MTKLKTKGLPLVHLLALLVMGFMVIAHGKLKAALSVKNGRNNSAAFYILGDSSVDCGDNTLFYPLIHSYLSLYSCNGSDDKSLIPHLLAEKMGMPNILPFYSQNGSIDGILRGLNFGSAQATIMNRGSQSYQSVNQQLRQVSDSMQLLQLQLSEDRALHFIKSSIFYLSFGKDDFIDLFLRNGSVTAKQNSSDENFSHILADQMMHVIRNLYDMNVRRIICMGILPLGCTPRVLLDQYNSTASQDDNDHDDDARGCVEEINAQLSAVSPAPSNPLQFICNFKFTIEESIIQSTPVFAHCSPTPTSSLPSIWSPASFSAVDRTQFQLHLRRRKAQSRCPCLTVGDSIFSDQFRSTTVLLDAAGVDPQTPLQSFRRRSLYLAAPPASDHSTASSPQLSAAALPSSFSRSPPSSPSPLGLSLNIKSQLSLPVNSLAQSTLSLFLYLIIFYYILCISF